ncbi:proprotein convertase subtilisin/kexin type 6-like isoform X2 [Oncorhynchus keta]|uniref:proprotein convertase subtilisin/kexin type 6-like isoform X2 n=1 Tax=Oncorhynchus keta TaxID=8018 RepID=UPI0015F8D87D|nr:proprotein convertase subtilisin/kexin type 6-like isoform X2 [Oncorhynchus keta]
MLPAAVASSDHRGAARHQAPLLLCCGDGQRRHRCTSPGRAARTTVHITDRPPGGPLHPERQQGEPWQREQGVAGEAELSYPDVDRTLKTEDQLDHALTFNDPLWPMQWELFKHGQYSSCHFDLNVMPVWSRNSTGNGVEVSIIDDGVDHTNLDLNRNFEALASFDLRGSHSLSRDPMPLRDEENSHGTRCGGEVAMEASSSYCGVGMAFNARIGGEYNTAHVQCQCDLSK